MNQGPPGVAALRNAKVAFGTKAETLERLAPVLRLASVLPLVRFTYAAWTDAPGVVVTAAQALGADQVIVRSSRRAEDSLWDSQAGAYESVPHVPLADRSALATAIDRVVASYGEPLGDDQVFIQPQLQGVRCAGVLFSRDLDTLAPYFVATWDEAGTTDTVTAGRASATVTHVAFRDETREGGDPRVSRLVACTRELEELLGCDHLDVEFAFLHDSTLVVLQVRPLVASGAQHTPPDARIAVCLHKAHKKLDKLSLPHPDLAGRRTLFGVMPDWNPAEMIGTRPRALAVSLYKELITDSVWAHQRAEYGYRDVRGFPLLVSLFGMPFIDVRVCFNSFVPRELDEGLAHKLVDHYLDSLERNPSDHDKVEFNILLTCATPSLIERVKRLRAHGFSENEIDRIKFALLNLTNRILDPDTGLYVRDLARIDVLDRRREALHVGRMSTLQKIYWLVEDCKRYGTLPFAGLARAGFVAVELLRSLVELGLLSAEEQATFMGSLDTVAFRLSADAARVARGELAMGALLREYGHLRPGTYDILSHRYDEAPELYLRGGPGAPAEASVRLELSHARRRAITAALTESGFHVDCDGLFAFARGAIEAREYGKFVFTRNVSDALALMGRLGERFGLNREDMSWVHIQTVLSLYADLDAKDVDVVLRADIDRNREAWMLTRALRLPQLLISPDDVYAHRTLDVQPNFVSTRRVSADVVTEADLCRVEPAGRIVLIRGADPGYDWLFGRGIAGLVTAWGGVNSHMAIRAAQLDLPAVIGCGEERFDAWSRTRRLELDCPAGLVRVLS